MAHPVLWGGYLVVLIAAPAFGAWGWNDGMRISAEGSGPPAASDPAQIPVDRVDIPAESQGIDVSVDNRGRPQRRIVISGVVAFHDGTPASGIPLIWIGIADSAGIDMATSTGQDGSFSLVAPRGWQGIAASDANHRLEPAARLVQAFGLNRLTLDYIVFRNYFVHSSGPGNAGSGSFGSPFTIIQHAASRARAGDTIYLRHGDYDLRGDEGYDHDVIYFSHSGAVGRPITVQAYPGERVTLVTAESKPVFDFSSVWGHDTAGFGHYVFRNLKIVGGRYGWMIRPPLPLDWQPGIDPLSELLVGQLHDILIEDCEVDGAGTVESAIYIRNAGVRNLAVRRCNFHHTIGTEGTVDVGEWADAEPGHLIPQSASRSLLFEDCDFHHALHQQSNGIVTQPCVHDVTFRRCRAWNNGKYGFACKGSGGFRFDRCAAWGNDSSQMYCRGFGGDDSTPRPFVLNDFLITNSVFVAPADQRGGAALNWRENTDLRVIQCTIVGLRNAAYGQAGGYSFLLGSQHNIPSSAFLQNCIVAGFTDSTAIRLSVSNGKPYLTNTRYEAANNLHFAQASTKFKYQARNWQTLAPWQTYWTAGEPNGDDALNGPTATFADATSLFADPAFVSLNPAATPLRKLWADDLFDPINACDIHLAPNSAAVDLGENLSPLGIPELAVDYFGTLRPTTGPWTVGALQAD